MVPPTWDMVAMVFDVDVGVGVKPEFAAAEVEHFRNDTTSVLDVVKLAG